MLQLTARPKRRFSAVVFSIVAHVVIVFGILAARTPQGAKVEAAAPKVTFFSLPPPAPAPPPPPPPKAKPHHVKKPTPQQVVEPVKVPEPTPTPKLTQVEPKAKEEPAKDDDAGSDQGVEGGVPGGVPGGVVGGVVGGVPGGTGTAPAKAKPKNVPAFVINRDVLRQDPIHLSEVFKQAHRGRGAINGMYKVCVGLDGHVYDVIAVKSVPGADEDIIRGIKEGWQYKNQQVPVCFLYNMPISIIQ